ncbi:protein-disulfide reductase DsbD [Candidatus Colwellia aromaticivorans]|uniref:protein-disulfide reductase DsbD n=1 Tax=Candidatus Colwellia aromaticivorans TaxID=2267621 RepID=UPI003CCC5D00
MNLIVGLLLTLVTLLPTISHAQQSIFDTSSSSLFSNDDEFLKVDQAFSFNFDQQNDQLHVNFDISEGYYLYRHQFKFTANNASYSTIDLPTGLDHEDEFFGVQQIYKEQLNFTINIEQANEDASITIRYQGCADKGLCYPPTKKVIALDSVLTPNDATAVFSALTKVNDSATLAEQKSKNIEQVTSSSEQHQLADMLKQGSLILTLIAFFVGGLLLSFTPCVFPMYPILTGIIVGQGKALTTKKAFTLSFFYVQGMAVTYTLLGIVVALAGAQFQAIFQHPFVLIALSILFIFLALSMFGIFNLALPTSWQNKLNNISNKQKGGSIAGVVMMGVISGLVASPCTTAPLTGALLYISQTGDVVLGASALYALSLGMGLPLLILGSSGGKLLPKAGAWMNVIKNIFGLLLLAVPIFLLERFIPEMASQALWALLLLSAASYFYVTNINANNRGFWFGARSLAIFLMLFVGANMAYQLIVPKHNLPAVESNTTQKVQHFTQVKTLDELQTAITQANEQGKTVMLDLYADWCIACKEFEKYTFSDSKVQKSLANSVLLQIDLTDTGTKKNIELMEHFNVFGLPSILFFNLQGEELSQQRITGFMGANEFSAHVKIIFN